MSCVFFQEDVHRCGHLFLAKYIYSPPFRNWPVCQILYWTSLASWTSVAFLCTSITCGYYVRDPIIKFQCYLTALLLDISLIFNQVTRHEYPFSNIQTYPHSKLKVSSIFVTSPESITTSYFGTCRGALLQSIYDLPSKFPWGKNYYLTPMLGN